MNLKLMPMLAGAVAAVAIAVTPLVAAAQGQTPQAEQPTPTRIVLDERQQAQFEQIQANALTRIEAVLEGEQKTQFATGLTDGRGLAAVEDLTDPQLAEIQKILQQVNDDIGSILTAEQKRQIEESMQNQQ